MPKEVPVGLADVRGEQGIHGEKGKAGGVKGAQYGDLGRASGSLGGSAGGSAGKKSGKHSSVSGASFTVTQKLEVIAAIESQDAEVASGKRKGRSWVAILSKFFPNARTKQEKDNATQNAKNWFSKRESLKAAHCLRRGGMKTLHSGPQSRWQQYESTIMQRLLRVQQEKGGVSVRNVAHIFLDVLEEAKVQRIPVLFDGLLEDLTDSEVQELLGVTGVYRSREANGADVLSGSYIRRMLHRHGWQKLGTSYHTLYDMKQVLNDLAPRLCSVWAFRRAAVLGDGCVWNHDQTLQHRFVEDTKKWVCATERRSRGKSRQAEKEAFACVTTTCSDGTVRPWQVVIKRASGFVSNLLERQLGDCGVDTADTSNIVVGASKDGWQHADNRDDSLHTIFATQAEPVIMVLDNHHLFQNAEWLKQLAENNIFVFFGPSGSTGVCHVQKKTKITIYSDVG